MDLTQRMTQLCSHITDNWANNQILTSIFRNFNRSLLKNTFSFHFFRWIYEKAKHSTFSTGIKLFFYTNKIISKELLAVQNWHISLCVLKSFWEKWKSRGQKKRLSRADEQYLKFLRNMKEFSSSKDRDASAVHWSLTNGLGE